MIAQEARGQVLHGRGLPRLLALLGRIIAGADAGQGLLGECARQVRG